MQAFNTHSFRYEALDKQLNVISDISEYVEQGGTITYGSLTRLKANCTIPVSIATDEQLNLEAIRIYNVLNGVEECIGTFYISTPESKYDDAVQDIECTGYSTLIRIANNSPENRYFVGKGTNAVAEVKRILTGLGYSFNIPDSDKTTSTDKEFEIGTYYLDIINYLLDVVNYTSLYVDVYGSYISKPYTLPQDRIPDVEYSDKDIENIIEPLQTNTLDTFNIPNRFIRYCSSDPEQDLYAVYTNVDGITGTNKTWVNADCQEVNDAADYDTLYEMCKKACAEATSIYNKVQISTAISMLPTYLPIIQLNHYQAKGKYTCTSFDIKLETGGSMSLSLRKVVNV